MGGKKAFSYDPNHKAKGKGRRRGKISTDVDATELTGSVTWYAPPTVPEGHQLLVIDGYTMGRTTSENSTPQFIILPTSSAELINTVNRIPGIGANATTETEAYAALASSNACFISSTNDASTVTDGLVLELNSKTKNSYPGTGTTWYDLSGNGYNATLYNSPSFLDGKFVLDNADDYILASFNEGVLKQTNQSGTWTIETSFIYNGNSSNSEAIIAGRAGHHGGIYMYSNDILRHAVKTDQGWTGAVNTAIATLQDGRGYHTVMTYNNGTIKSYLNGEYVSTSTLDLNTYDMRTYDNTFYIGGISNRYNDISLGNC